jgi:conjugative relaxase-like TrwC/TraI family protein
VAVVATLSKGYDLEYIWKQVDRGPAKDAASYYIQASETGGEPPGRWWGPGAKALGFDNGQRVERKPYDLLFGKRKAPDGAQLGRPPGNGRKAADLYAKLLAAEPHAAAERRRELRIEATKQARQSLLFFDLTLSLSKSISIFHASLGENARLARQACDKEGDAYWSALVGEVDDMIWEAVHAGFVYFQREAGYTRTGSHTTRVHGRETGQWHEADLAVAHWLQHTSRDGDMQLHVHSQIAHVTRTATDGKWRAPDSLGYNEHIGAVAAIVSQHLEEALTGRFGLEWTARDDGHGFEIKGITGAMMRLFSSRRASITTDLRARAARFEQQYKRKPSQRELAQLAQASNFKTRAAKEGALDFAQLHAGWADKLARTLGVSLASVAPSVWHDGEGRAGVDTRGPNPPGPVPAELERARAAQKAVALAQQEKSTWTRGCDQVPRQGPAPHRPGPSRGRRAARRPSRPRPAIRVRASHLPGNTRADGSPAQLAARGRAQHLPAARRRAVRHARAAGHGRAHAHASRRERRAALDPRAGRARARRRPRAARRRAGRTRGRHAGHAHANRSAHRASGDVINAFAALDVARMWGDGSVAAVDGSQIEMWENNTLAETSIRYGGFGGIAFRLVSDTYIALFSHFIPCGVPGFKGWSQHCLVGRSIGTHPVPLRGSSSRGSCGGGR